MVFSSLEFLFLFLPITLMLYYAVPKKYRVWRNVVLLVMSLVFYGWGEPKYVLLMVFTILADYGAGMLIGWFRDVKDKPKAAKAVLISSIVLNLLILGFFKYYDFLISNLRLIPGLGGLKTLGLALPVGISFYTFQALSYVIDVYRDDARVQKNPISFGTYVTLYPQLVAGPIVRYQDVDDMLRDRTESRALFASGVRTFLAGLGKKMLLGNVAGMMWDTISAAPERSVVGAWLGIIFYTFHIYFDFSGYSDMAIGLGKMIGFRFLENFNYPYIAESITDFWRRWHMSLSTWFREYVYFPLGGSRCDKKWKNYRNIFIVWLLTGVWHGANWNYILWGLYYFVLLMIEKTFLKKYLDRAPSWVRHLYALFFICIGWLIFAETDLAAGTAYLGNLFGIGANGFIDSVALYDLTRNLPYLLLLGIASTPLPRKLFYRLYEKKPSFRTVAAVGGILLLVVCTAYLVASSYNPFIYYIF